MKTVAAAVLIAAVTATAADDLRLPDISTGQINGKVAMLVWPIEGVDLRADGAKAQRLLPPEGCETHLVPREDPERELLFPCGRWFQPPEGTYRVWLEKPGFSTAGFGVVSYEAAPFDGRGMAMMMPLEPAGRVALAKQVPLADGASFRLLQIRGPKNGILLAPFDRRINATAACAGVQMGVGTVLAAIFDRRTNDAIALAPPVPVAAGQTSYAVPAPPVQGTDVFVTLERPRTVTVGEDEVALALQLGEVARKPDLFMNTPRRVFAVWYGIEGKTANLRVDSESLRYAGPPLVLRPKQVVTVRGKLEALPSLGISLFAPEGALRDAEPRIEVRRPGSNEPARPAALIAPPCGTSFATEPSAAPIGATRLASLRLCRAGNESSSSGIPPPTTAPRSSSRTARVPLSSRASSTFGEAARSTSTYRPPATRSAWSMQTRGNRSPAPESSPGTTGVRATAAAPCRRRSRMKGGTRACRPCAKAKWSSAPVPRGTSIPGRREEPSRRSMRKVTSTGAGVEKRGFDRERRLRRRGHARRLPLAAGDPAHAAGLNLPPNGSGTTLYAGGQRWIRSTPDFAIESTPDGRSRAVCSTMRMESRCWFSVSRAAAS